MSSEKRPYTLRARAERQQRTRERIVAATAELHEEVGPARTTVAEIARRAGVQRLTVYNHFPEEGELFAACQAKFFADHPPPDLEAALAATDPRERIARALAALYASYRDQEPMTAKVLRDRAVLPELDALLRDTLDARLAQLAGALAAGLDDQRARLLIALALDFATWQRLTREGLGDDEAARLMADAVACATASRC